MTFSNLPEDVSIFLTIALVALLGAILLILFLFLSRILKNEKIVKEMNLRNRFQRSLNMIMLMEDDGAMQLSSSQFYISELNKDMGNSGLAKQIMIDQLIGLQKNITGSSAETIVSLFDTLKLNHFSQSKLKSHQWNIKAQGIAELGQMQNINASPLIIPFLTNKNQTLREEALMALVKLDKNLSLSFLNDYRAPLSPWIAMRLFQHLSNSDKRNLPDFSKWFNHSNNDVVLFAIEMTKRFRQLNAGPQLAALLVQEKEKIIAAVETLGELEIHDKVETILSCGENRWADNEISKAIVACLGKIGHTDNHWSFVAKYLTHPNYTVRFEAAKTLNSSGETAKRKLEITNNENDKAFQSMIAHVEETLLT